MKRIEFIAPVEAMRGNLSGKQDLLYAENDNKAYYGPVGSVNYARNYSPRFIGAKVAKSGMKYFTVRTKTANHLTSKAKKAMALLGGTGAIFGAILKNKSSQLYANLYAQWLELQNLGSTQTFRESVSAAIRTGLIDKAAEIVYAGPRGAVYIDNPWVKGDDVLNVSISQQILVKFWSELSDDGVTFTIDGLTGIAQKNSDFQSVASTTRLNVLGLQVQSLSEYVNAVTMNGRYVQKSDNTYVEPSDAIVDLAEYKTTDVAPE